MQTYREYFTEVLDGCKLPVYEGGLEAFYSVSTLEGLQGTTQTGPQRYNPLNSVVPHGNSTKYNDVGVQDYKSFENGVAGTVQLLLGSPWDIVRYRLRNKQPAHMVLEAFAEVYQGWEKGFTADRFPKNVKLGDEVMTTHGPVPAPHGPPPPVKHPGHGETYTVKEGDTLWSIATHFYGSGTLYPLIAHRNMIANPDVIRVGETLVIPPYHP